MAGSFSRTSAAPAPFSAREGTRSRTRPGIQCAVWTGPVRSIGMSVRRRNLFLPNSPARSNPVRMCMTPRPFCASELYADPAAGIHFPETEPAQAGRLPRSVVSWQNCRRPMSLP